MNGAPDVRAAGTKGKCGDSSPTAQNDRFVSLWGERFERLWRDGQRRGPSTARFGLAALRIKVMD